MRRVNRTLLHRGKVIFENEGVGVSRIANAVRSRIARAKIAVRIERRTFIRNERGHLALPWTVHAMWRNKYPLLRQRVVSAMRFLLQIQHKPTYVVAKQPSVAVHT